MRIKNNVYINLRTDFNSAVKRIYVNFSRIIDTQRDSSFMAKLPIKLHETSIRSCIEYPYPSGFFFLFSFFFLFTRKVVFSFLRCIRDDAKMDRSERNARYTHVCRAFQKSKCHFDFYSCRSSLSFPNSRVYLSRKFLWFIGLSLLELLS